MNSLGKYLLVLVMVVCAATTTRAQEHQTDTFTFEFRGESMEEVLDQLANVMEIDLVYDPNLVHEMNVFKRFRDQTKEEVFSNLLGEFYLDYITLSSGTIVIVKSTLDSPQFGSLSGKIMDNHTGKPLPGANVMLADATGGTSTGSSGNFSLNKLMSGSYEIIVSYVGYEPVTKSIYIPPGENVQEQIGLSSKPIFITPLLVETHRPRFDISSSSSTGEDWQTAEVMKNPIRNLSLMQGVQYGLPLSDLHIQGGERGDHRIYLDEVPIYNPYSFGRMFSSFSPFAIGDVTLHKAGYGVAQGSQMAGMIDLSHDISNANENQAVVQADPLSINFRGDVAIPVNDEKSVQTMMAVRTNLWDLYKDPALSQMMEEWDQIDPLLANLHLENENALDYSPTLQQADVGFLDTHFAASYEPGPFSRLNGSIYFAENNLGSDLLSENRTNQDAPRYLYASDSYEWSNLAGQLSWEQLVSPRLDISAKVGYSQNQFGHQNILSTRETRPTLGMTNTSAEFAYDEVEGYRSVLPTQVDENSIRHTFLKADFSYSYTPMFSFDGGLKSDFIKSEVEISEETVFPANTEESSVLLSGYLQNNHSFSKGWSVDYGSRFTWLNRKNRVYAEPRASVQYDKSESRIGYWSVRFAGGLYRQFINEYRVTNVGASSLVPDFSIWSHAGEMNIPLATHVTGSFLVEPSARTSLTIEGFYKWQPQTPVTSYGNLVSGDNPNRAETGAFAELTELNALGAGFRFRQTANSRIRFLGGYDYSYTRLDLESQFGRSVPSSWNEPHRAQFRAFYIVAEGITFVVKWQGIWGRKWGFRDSYYNYLRFRDVNTAGEFTFDSPENDHLSAFHQVDVSMIYQPTIGVADLEVRLELINILNRRNTLDQNLVPIISSDESVEYRIDERQLPGFYPTMSVQVQF
ncbi:MAG: carboxypeptidase-like regulatory domain-containing protein [Balneolaceae bacterium]